tara:strand:+ start:62 stop:466 length:405 start_codon:yes stop_codon:yes gene_type:complete
MFYDGMINAMGGNLGNAGAVIGGDVADLFKKRMQEGSAQNAMDMMRRSAAADQQRMQMGVLGNQVGNVQGMTQNPQDVAFLGGLFNKPVMPDNSVEFGGKKIDKNFYEQLKNNPERMQEYIRQQYLEEGGKKYF